MLDFPVNNSAIYNAGISEIYTNDSYNTNYPDGGNQNYITSIDTGADPVDPADNSANMATSTPGAPPLLVSWYYKVSRSATLKFYTGGGATTPAGRYSLQISGSNDNDERAQSLELGSRCSVMINQE